MKRNEMWDYSTEYAIARIIIIIREKKKQFNNNNNKPVEIKITSRPLFLLPSPTTPNCIAL